MREFKQAIGRSRSGDQLHLCTAIIENGKTFTTNNAHCNQHMRLFPAQGRPEQNVYRFRAGLFCVKCFGGGDPSGREFINAIVTNEGQK